MLGTSSLSVMLIYLTWRSGAIYCRIGCFFLWFRGIQKKSLSGLRSTKKALSPGSRMGFTSRTDCFYVGKGLVFIWRSRGLRKEIGLPPILLAPFNKSWTIRISKKISGEPGELLLHPERQPCWDRPTRWTSWKGLKKARSQAEWSRLRKGPLLQAWTWLKWSKKTYARARLGK